MAYGRGRYGKGQWVVAAGADAQPPALATAGRQFERERPPSLQYTIFGKDASDLEWLTYRSLGRLGWRDGEIDFQVDFLGGRLPGGVVLDFVVWTFGGPIILEPSGDYWHASSLAQAQRDRQRTATIADTWRRPFRYHSLPLADFVSEAVTDLRLLLHVGRG